MLRNGTFHFPHHIVHVVIFCSHPTPTLVVPDFIVPLDKTSAKWTVLTAPYHVTRSGKCAVLLGETSSEMTCDPQSYMPALRSFIEVTEKHPASYFLNPLHSENTNKRWHVGMEKQYGTTGEEESCQRLILVRKAQVTTWLSKKGYLDSLLLRKSLQDIQWISKRNIVVSTVTGLHPGQRSHGSIPGMDKRLFSKTSESAPETMQRLI